MRRDRRGSDLSASVVLKRLHLHREPCKELLSNRGEQSNPKSKAPAGVAVSKFPPSEPPEPDAAAGQGSDKVGRGSAGCSSNAQRHPQPSGEIVD